MIDPQFGIHTREKLKAARTAAGGSLQWPEVDRIIQECHEAHELQFNAGSPPPEKRPRRKTPLNQMTDEEFLAELEQTPAYEGIDIKRELGKAQTWYKLRGKVATRMCIINWLNKADRTIGYDGQGKSSAKPERPQIDPYREPENWRHRAHQAFPTADFDGKQWGELGILIRTEILRKSAATPNQ